MTDPAAALRGELRLGETLLWSSRPRPMAFARTHLVTALFGMVWTSVVARGWSTAEAPSLPLIFFLLIGLGMMLAAPFGWLQAHWMAYGITNRRALIQCRMPLRRRMASVTLSSIVGAQRRDRADGSGDLLFITTIQTGESGTYAVRTGFLGIEDVRAVEALLVRGTG